MRQSVQNTPSSLNQSYGASEIVHQRQRTIDSLALCAGQKVLDVGCGTGFLSHPMAELVGAKGRIHAVDKEPDMITETLKRCKDQAQVSAAEGDVTDLQFEDGYFDAVTCTQVLLYVGDVEGAIAEMFRVLKPGGRLAILETDWRTTVMHSNHPALTDTIYRAWDETVPSSNLPVRLKKLMSDVGLNDIRAEGIPLLNTEFDPGCFSVSSLDWMSGNAYKRGAISKEESRMWRDDLAALGESGEYFFCVNRFLFVGVKGG